MIQAFAVVKDRPNSHNLVPNQPPITKIVRDKRTCPDNAWMFDEARVYAMALETLVSLNDISPPLDALGDLPNFSNPIAQGVMDQLKEIRAIIEAMPGAILCEI